jgi:uncharacterized membrane protein
MDRRFIVIALGYAILGLALGIYMAATKNHGQLVTHAHILLVGFVVNFIYGVLHKLWISGQCERIAKVQFVLHQLGTVILVLGLFLLFTGIVPESTLGPILGIGSISVLVGMILMKVMYLKSTK